MALPVISSWPFKIIDGYKSEWNAASTPIQYGLTNTKWPVNSEDSTVAITSITDTNGNATLQHGSSTGIVAKEWVLVAGTTNYNGAHQVLSVSTNALIIDFPFGASETGTSQVYFQNYTTLIQVRAGIDPAHIHTALKPIVLIGTIEQRPDTTNITLADVADFIKEKLLLTYDESQLSWPNDINAWCDFYISFAERYDLVVAGSVTDFTSIFTDDEADGGINYLKAVHGGNQFGADRGGNMHDYVVKESPYVTLAKWMTDFTRISLRDDMNFNISIIIDFQNTNNLTLQIVEYDINRDVIVTQDASIGNEESGLYRVNFDVTIDSSAEYIEMTVQNDGVDVSETLTADVCNLVRPGESFLLQEDSFLIQLEDSGFLILE